MAKSNITAQFCRNRANYMSEVTGRKFIYESGSAYYSHKFSTDDGKREIVLRGNTKDDLVNQSESFMLGYMLAKDGN